MDFEPYLRQLSTSNWSQHTINAYRSDLQFFAAFLKNRGLRITQVTPSIICDYVAHMKALPNPRFKREGLKPASIERRLAAISGFFDYLRTTSNPRLRNPTQIRRRLRGPRCKDFKGKAVDEVCLEKLLEGVTSFRDRALFSMLLTSGLRLSEVQQLNIDSIEEVAEEGPDGRIRTWGTGRVIGKGRKERVFFFDEATGKALKAYLSTRRDRCPALFLSERNVTAVNSGQPGPLGQKAKPQSHPSPSTQA